jgi:hypothetical protein
MVPSRAGWVPPPVPRPRLFTQRGGINISRNPNIWKIVRSISGTERYDRSDGMPALCGQHITAEHVYAFISSVDILASNN